MENETKGAGGKFAVPASIIVAGLLIAGAIVYSRNLASPTTASVREAAGQGQRTAPDENPFGNLSPVTSRDHIRGDVNAPFKIFDFSDSIGPYCRICNGSMRRFLRN